MTESSATNKKKSAAPRPTAALRRHREHAARVVALLEQVYPDAACALEYGGDPWKLLGVGRLSAQCTDARVNLVCRDLFRKYPTVQAMADADLDELCEAVRSCGLYRTKGANLKEASRILVEQYGGAVPDDMDALLALPGVGRKIANLLLGDLFGKPAIVADTHLICVCGRLGFYPTSLKDPVKVEKILAEIVEPAKQSDFCHRIVQFGRDFCTARSPKCAQCPLKDECKYAGDAMRGTS
jgi:endonuclease-3